MNEAKGRDGLAPNFEGKKLSGATQALIKEQLDLMFNDSENLERTMKLIADDCVWVMEPGGSEYHGYDEIRAFVGIAMSGRTHDEGHKLELLNWFADDENLCIEYTHGARFTGKSFAGIRGSIKTGVSRYCITWHFRDGKIDRVHEYINSTSSWLSLLSPFVLGRLHGQTMKRLAKAKKKGVRISPE
jgi:SnoaL-like domain